MFCRVMGVAALGLLISSAAWAQDTQGQGTTGTTDKTGAQTEDTSTTTQTTTTTPQTMDTDTDTSDRPRLELTGFAGYAFNDVVDFNSDRGVTNADVNFYNSIGPRDRLSYGAGIGYDVTSNLQIGFLWSRLSSPLEMRGFTSSAALAGGWSGPAGSNSGTATGETGGTGTGGTGTGTGDGTGATGTGGTGTGTGTTRSFPVLTTTNGVTPYQIGDMDVNTFHGTLGWNFGPVDAVVRPFIFGGAGVTRYGEVNYQFANTTGTGTAASTMTSARIGSDSRFSTTWGVGVKIAPRKGRAAVSPV